MLRKPVEHERTTGRHGVSSSGTQAQPNLTARIRVGRQGRRRNLIGRKKHVESWPKGSDRWVSGRGVPRGQAAYLGLRSSESVISSIRIVGV